MQYGRESIEIAKRQSQTNEERKDAEDRKSLLNGYAKPVSDSPQDTHGDNGHKQGGVLVNSSHVISHDLILQPDPELNYNGVQSDSVSSFHCFEWKLEVPSFIQLNCVYLLFINLF